MMRKSIHEISFHGLSTGIWLFNSIHSVPHCWKLVKMGGEDILQLYQITQDFGFLWLVTNISENTLLQFSKSEMQRVAVSSSVMFVTSCHTTRCHIPHKRLCSDITHLSFTSLRCSAGLGSWRICVQHCWTLPCSETRCHSSQSHLYVLRLPASSRAAPRARRNPGIAFRQRWSSAAMFGDDLANQYCCMMSLWWQ